MFLHKEPRFYASVGYDRGKYAINGEEFILKCRAGEMQGSVLDASKEYQSCTGYILTMKESGVRTFESPKTYWMAIPLSEININYNLVQNPGY